jgi:hypothetical protein
MSSYFSVSIDAAKAIVNQTDGPHVLAGYIVACSGAFDDGRWQTATGANRIKKKLGCTDFRSKKIMKELNAFRFGDLGLLAPTKRRVGPSKAVVYRIHEWPGEFAYVPSLLVDAQTHTGSPISRLVSAAGEHESGTQRDALLLLLYVYANTDYAGWFGCPPDLMATMKWKKDGHRHEFELGHVGSIGAHDIWLIAEHDGEDQSWAVPTRVIETLFGNSQEVAKGRFWAAFRCLRQLDLLVDVLAIQTTSWSYPLWIFSAAYRDAMRAEFGQLGDLGAEIHKYAGAAGLDPDNYIIQLATDYDATDRQGTGIFFCVGAGVTPYLVLAPRLHAPTPTNLDGIREVAALASEIVRDLRLAVAGGKYESVA